MHLKVRILRIKSKFCIQKVRILWLKVQTTFDKFKFRKYDFIISEFWVNENSWCAERGSSTDMVWISPKKVRIFTLISYSSALIQSQNSVNKNQNSEIKIRTLCLKARIPWLNVKTLSLKVRTHRWKLRILTSLSQNSGLMNTQISVIHSPEFQSQYSVIKIQNSEF